MSKRTVAKGVSIPSKEAENLRKKPGGGNSGKYKDVGSGEFAGSAGHTSPYSYPIDTKARAKSALKLAHNAPDPAGIRKAVHEKYPGLGGKK
jgi:hypothetical protein